MRCFNRSADPAYPDNEGAGADQYIYTQLYHPTQPDGSFNHLLNRELELGMRTLPPSINWVGRASGRGVIRTSYSGPQALPKGRIPPTILQRAGGGGGGPGYAEQKSIRNVPAPLILTDGSGVDRWMEELLRMPGRI